MNRDLEREILLNIRESAHYLGVSEKTISRWIGKGRLKAYKFGEKIVRISTSELEKFKRASL